jgi:peptidyl-prolyl cis-trans isomerase B (cyclophilin B)
MIPRSIRAMAALTVLAVVAACSPAPGASPSAAPSLAAPSGETPTGSSAAGSCPTSEPAALPAGATRTVTIETSKGTMTFDLQADLSPIAVGNFVALAECGFYDGVVFHRLVPNFVIQGGDPDGTGTGGPGYTITDEPVTTEYRRGTVAMARTREPNSVGSQFFVVLVDEARESLALANTYQIIGEVTEGMDVVDAIAAMPNSGDQTGNQALEPVAMDRVTVSEP